MTAVTVGFVIGKATSTRQSPVYKAVLDFDIGMLMLQCKLLNHFSFTNLLIQHTIFFFSL